KMPPRFGVPVVAGVAACAPVTAGAVVAAAVTAGGVAELGVAGWQAARRNATDDAAPPAAIEPTKRRRVSPRKRDSDGMRLTSARKGRQDVFAQQAKTEVDIRPKLGEHELLEAEFTRESAHLRELFTAAHRVARDEQRVDHGIGDQFRQCGTWRAATRRGEQSLDILRRNAQASILIPRVASLEQADDAR